MAFGLFKKKKVKTDDRYLNLKVKEVVHIAKDAVNLVFEKPESFDYQPGQFITIISEIAGKKIRRAYSLCTTPFEDENPAVTVKRVPEGAMSNFLNDKVSSGTELEVMEPMGIFTTEYSESNSRQALFFGGGSGITPLISMLRSILLKEPNSKVTLVYANRSEEYIIFKDLIEELKGKYSDRFNAIHILESGSSDYEGRLTEDIIKEVTSKEKCDDKTEFYICGPQPMMDIAEKGLQAVGFKADNIRMESFEAGKTSPKEIIDEDSSNGADVTILLDGQEHQVSVDKDEAILDAALANDLDMPYSCQSGLCTACRGKCLEGEISIEEAEGLSQDELDEGYVLTCIGKPLTDKVVVEIG